MNSIIRRNSGDFFPTIVGRSLFDDVFADFEENFDRFFGNTQVVPYDFIHNKDKDGNITSSEIQLALAGYSEKDISVEIDGDVMTVKVEKEEKVEDSGKNYLHKGISHRRIETSYNISGYDKEKISSSFENGILKIELPASDKKEVKKIAVKTSKALPEGKE